MGVWAFHRYSDFCHLAILVKSDLMKGIVFLICKRLLVRIFRMELITVDFPGEVARVQAIDAFALIV